MNQPTPRGVIENSPRSFFNFKHNGFAFMAAIGKIDHADAISKSFGSR